MTGVAGIIERMGTPAHMLTVDEAAERLNVHAATVRRWIRDGHLRGHQYVPGGSYRIDPRDLHPEPPKLHWMSPS